MGLETFLFQKTYWGQHNELFTYARTFHQVFTAIDHAVFNWCSLKSSSVKLTKLLVTCRCLNAPSKLLYVNLPFKRLALPFVTFWKLKRSHTVTPCWLDDAKGCIKSGGANSMFVAHCTLNPGRGCWSLWKLHFSKIIWRLALGL